MNGYNPSAAMGDFYSYGVPVASSSDATPAGGRNGYTGPLNGFELQPSEACPKNFIIFDQSENKSRVMFHPALATKFNYQNFDFGGTHEQDYGRSHDRYTDNGDRVASSLKEDLDDIDALLSLEEEDDDAGEDDVVSTGRTPANYGTNSPDSMCSTDGSKSHNLRFPPQTSTSNAVSVRKKERMRKMVKALKGIIPGGEEMDTPAILDEAVCYLKSLKVQMKKLGIRNLKN